MGWWFLWIKYYKQEQKGVSAARNYAVKKARVISHEIKNQLSICDLYTEIIRKQEMHKKTQGNIRVRRIDN